MSLCKIHVILHQMGFDTKAYKNYVAYLQMKLDDNWFNRHVDDYWTYWHKCRVGKFDFTGEYNEAIKKYHLTAEEAYNYVFEEFINK